MLYLIGVLIFAFGLLGSIALHEVGHMVPAKKFGVKVTQYMVGFGPTLWSKRKGDTEYGVKAIPLGGYIRMIGMVPPRIDGKRSRWPRRLAGAVEEFRNTSRSEAVTIEDEPRQFYRLTPGKKMIVMTGGPLMNFFIYVVLTIILITVVGTRHDDATTTVDSVVQCVVPASSTESDTTTCPADAVPAPAYGKLQPGDQVESVAGVKVTSWDDAVNVIEASAGKSLSVVVKRNGADVPLSITPVDNVKCANDLCTKTKVAGYIGVSPGIHSYYKQDSILAVPRKVADQFGQGISVIGGYPSRVASVWDAVFEGKKRDPNGAVGVVGIGRLGGDIANSNQFDVHDKVFLLISLLASVNLLLFIFNLLPLLPLDGGHVAGAILEAAKRGRARLKARSLAAVGHGPRGPGAVDLQDASPKQQPIYVDTAQMLPVMYAVASVLILVTLLVMYADIVKPISLSG